MRRTRDSLTTIDQIIIGVIEGVSTILGLIVVVFPLAIWAVPQQGVSATMIYYIVLTIGGVSFVGLIALIYLKGMLYPDRLSQEVAASKETRLQAYLNWSETQEEVRKAKNQLRTMKGSALHDIGFMIRIASLLATVFVLVNLSAWAITVFFLGDPEFITPHERWQLLHPDPWGWK